jgi:hypothetical protein
MCCACVSKQMVPLASADGVLVQYNVSHGLGPFSLPDLEQWLRNRHEFTSMQQQQLLRAQQCMKAQADKHSGCLQHRLIQKGGTTSRQVLVRWNGLPSSLATWESYEELRRLHPSTAAWGQAFPSGGGGESVMLWALAGPQ